MKELFYLKAGWLCNNKFSYFVANNICCRTEYRLGNDSLFEPTYIQVFINFLASGY